MGILDSRRQLKIRRAEGVFSNAQDFGGSRLGQESIAIPSRWDLGGIKCEFSLKHHSYSLRSNHQAIRFQQTDASFAAPEDLRRIYLKVKRIIAAGCCCYLKSYLAITSKFDAAYSQNDASISVGYPCGKLRTFPMR
jgi:hypothetical protein